MNNKTDDMLVHPCTAIKLLERSVKDVGLNKIIRDRFYEKTREAWIASVFLLALRKIEGHPWWFKVNSDKHLAPDIYAYRFIEYEPRKVERQKRLIEVFRWVKTAKTTLLEEIERKIKKNYPSTFTLVCYVMKEEKVELQKIYTTLKKINPNLFEIWIVGTSKEKLRNILVGRIWPEVFSTKINLEESCIKTKDEPKILVPHRGYVKNSFYEKIGKVAILKPDFSLENID